MNVSIFKFEFRLISKCYNVFLVHGAAISTNLFMNINTSKIIDDDDDDEIDEGFTTIAQDARLIKCQLMQLT